MEGGPLPSVPQLCGQWGSICDSLQTPFPPLAKSRVLCTQLRNLQQCPIQVGILGPEEWGEEKPSLEQILIQTKPKSPAHTLTT